MESSEAINNTEGATGEPPAETPRYDHFSVSRQDIKAFCGKNAEIFLYVYDKGSTQGNNAFVASWCWTAAIFGFPWFMYRKMYVYAAGLFLAPILLFLIFPQFDFGGAGLAGILGIFSKSLYLQWAEKQISAINKLPGLSEEDRNEKIRNAGGVSLLGGVLGGLLFVALAGLVIISATAEQG